MGRMSDESTPPRTPSNTDQAAQGRPSCPRKTAPMRTTWKRAWSWAAAFALFTPFPAPAADLVHLVDVLTPILTVQQIQALCSSNDREFMSRPRASGWNVADYPKHMTGEVVAGLSAEESAVVINAAAGAALQKAKQQLRVISKDAVTIEPARLGEWCQTVARSYIQSVLALHDDHHDLFNQAILQAKDASH